MSEYKVLDRPLKKEDMDKDGWVKGVIELPLSELISTFSLEAFLDEISEKLVGDQLLMQVEYKIVGFSEDGDALHLEVRGDASLSFEKEDDSCSPDLSDEEEHSLIERLMS